MSISLIKGDNRRKGILSFYHLELTHLSEATKKSLLKDIRTALTAHKLTGEGKEINDLGVSVDIQLSILRSKQDPKDATEMILDG